MSKAAKLRILYGEGDAEAQVAAAAAFEKAGHSVQKALGRKAVVEALQKGTFDLVVLGPSLTRNDRHHLPYMVKKSAGGGRGAGDARGWKQASICGCVHGYGRERGECAGAD